VRRRLLGPTDAQAERGYKVDDNPFDVFVPPSYKPGTPHGLFVWLGVCDFQNDWCDVLGRHKLILVVVPKRKEEFFQYRIQTALDAVHNMHSRYELDDDRVYLGGFSAGAQMSGLLLRSFPDVFSGAVCLMQTSFYRARWNARARLSEPTVLRNGPDWFGPLDEIKQRVKLVFVQGELDPNLKPANARGEIESFRLDGFTRVTSFGVPNCGHSAPPAPWFDKAVAELESEPRKPPATQPTLNGAAPGRDQVAQAKRLLSTAELYLDEREQLRKSAAALQKNATAATRERKLREAIADATGSARPYLEQVLRDYPTAPAAQRARDLIATLGDGDGHGTMPP
jgi:predicted esterase